MRYAVVGLTFVDGYPDNLHELARIMGQEQHREEGPTALLIREPGNRYDVNAVEIHVPPIGQIGHLSRQAALVTAPLLDSGVKTTAEVSWVRINPDHLDRPGIDIIITFHEDHS